MRMRPVARQRQNLLGILRSVQGPTGARPHCIACRIYEEDGPDAAVLYVEHWTSDDEFEDHVRSNVYHRILAALELSRAEPEVRFDFVSRTAGLELLEKLRTAPSRGQGLAELTSDVKSR